MQRAAAIEFAQQIRKAATRLAKLHLGGYATKLFIDSVDQPGEDIGRRPELPHQRVIQRLSAASREASRELAGFT